MKTKESKQKREFEAAIIDKPREKQTITTVKVYEAGPDGVIRVYYQRIDPWDSK